MLSLQVEHRGAGERNLERIAGKILHLDFARRVVIDESRGDSIGRINGEPVQASKIAAQGAVFVEQADDAARAAGVDVESEIAEREPVGWGIGLEFSGFGELAAESESCAGIHMDDHIISLQVE